MRVASLAWQQEHGGQGGGVQKSKLGEHGQVHKVCCTSHTAQGALYADAVLQSWSLVGLGRLC
jgi:hypothetical protein